MLIHICRANAARTIAGREVRFAENISANVRKRVIEFLELHVFRRRYPELRPEIRKLRGQKHQLVRFGIGERSQHHAIDDRKDGGVGANTERESHNGNDGERGSAPQRAETMTQVSSEVVEPWPSALIAN